MDSPSSHKSSNGHNPDADFDALLRSAKIEIPLHASFQTEVWGRIAAAKDATFAARFSRWVEGFSHLLERPLAATTALLMMTAGGAWLGSRDVEPEPSGKLAYVQSVSPFAHPHSSVHK